jgi:hypothetical protein
MRENGVSFRGAGFLTAILLIPVALASCSKWNGDKAPAGFAIIREHVIDNPWNDPPIKSTFDVTIKAIDGAATKRETVPPWVDIQRGALIPAGSHHFTVLVMPSLHRPGDVAKEVSFVESVASRKVYYLVGKEDGQPALIEAHSRR